MKTDMLKRGWTLLAVTEADIVEADVAGHTNHLCAGSIPSRFNRFIDNFKDALAGGPPGLHQLVELMQFVAWLIKKSGQHQECDQITDLHRAAQHVARAHPDDENNPERADEIHGGVIDCPHPHHHKGRVAELVAD